MILSSASTSASNINEISKANNGDNNDDSKTVYIDLDNAARINTTNDLIDNFTNSCLEANTSVNTRIRRKKTQLTKINLNDNNSSDSTIYESSKMISCKTKNPVKRLTRKQQQQSKQLPQQLASGEWNEFINKGDVIQVNCNSIVGDLHKNKFGSGGKGKCIYVNSVDQWMTPIQFEKFCGKSNCKDWKRSIKFGGEQIYKLLDENVLLCHALSCSCAICSDDCNVVGPIRPFERKRRRKGPEIQAQNAFKKFLSLKPPTLLSSEPLFNRIERIQNNNSNSAGNTSNNNVAVSSNCVFRNDDMTNAASLSLNNSNSSSFSNDTVPKSSNTSLKYIKKLENDQWTLLEKAADMLISQAKNLKNLIEQAKNQSIITKKSLSNDKLKNKINKIFNNNNTSNNVNINYSQDNYDNNNQNDNDDEDESIDDNDQNNDVNGADDDDDDEDDENGDNEYEYANRIGQSQC